MKKFEETVLGEYVREHSDELAVNLGRFLGAIGILTQHNQKNPVRQIQKKFDETGLSTDTREGMIEVFRLGAQLALDLIDEYNSKKKGKAQKPKLTNQVRECMADSLVSVSAVVRLLSDKEVRKACQKKFPKGIDKENERQCIEFYVFALRAAADILTKHYGLFYENN